MKHLVIAGAGEFGRELYWTIKGANGYGTEFDIKGYLDDAPEPEKVAKLQKPLLGSTKEYQISEDDVFTCAIANPAAREVVIQKLLDKGAKFISIVHKTAIIHGSVNLGKGMVVCPFTVIGDSSVIGDYVVLNGFSAIGHDCVVGEYTCMMSHVDVTGHANVGRRVFIGGGAGTVPGVKIGDDAYIGAGSVVLKKVNPGIKVFGNPAVPI